ncbi:haloacid dehalogenase type II [Allobranchiibius sp. CTAmp26]|uniref:haloacid dehalogenase type II n=1 Tax=Allobranchiibius sp. CTAmp26 TaxID=2815214 RepID=UPI0027DBDDF8|nr:haloacid dehalogenase type II [Allobranchiibius sp. CTAmp26]
MTDRQPSNARPHHASDHPSLLVFDVNETLSDMSPMADRFAEVGAPAPLARSWFAGVLRDGFALTSIGVNERFATIAQESLRVLLDGEALDRSTGDAVQHVMEGFTGLSVHPDVADGIRTLADAGVRMVTLGNGSASLAEGLLDRAGVRDHFEALLSVEDAPLWKPAAAAYTHALQRCAVDAADAMLVAVHPWDIDGASRAGMRTAWINRDHAPYPTYFTSPDLNVASVIALSAAVTG